MRRIKPFIVPVLCAFALTALYFYIPTLSKNIASDPTFASYAIHDAERIALTVQKYLVFPLGKFLSAKWRAILVFPFYLILFLSLYFFIKKTWKYLRYFLLAFAVALLMLFCFPSLLQLTENDKRSESVGHVGNGSIQNAKRVDFRGDNFTTYSFLCYLAGRTYVHDKVKATILDAYSSCEKTCSGKTFVLGETGRCKGGRFMPHRTHQNGMSVDFMVPVLKKNKPYRFNWIFNIWGYGREFDNRGKKGKYEIDYEAIAKHLLALDQAAKKNGLVIQKVIFDPVLRKILLEKPGGDKIKSLPFTKKRVIIRHDDHYHVDFGIRKN